MKLESSLNDATIIDSEISLIIDMAWDDKISFDLIKKQTTLLEKDVIAIMRKNMKQSSFRMWRKRVCGRKSKHEKNMIPKHYNKKQH